MKHKLFCQKKKQNLLNPIGNLLKKIEMQYNY